MIYIYSVSWESNGYKGFSDLTKNPIKVPCSVNFSPTYTTLRDFNHYPEIIDGMVKFKRQITVNYKYKGKMYQLKTPVMDEEFKVIECDYNLITGMPYGKSFNRRECDNIY